MGQGSALCAALFAAVVAVALLLLVAEAAAEKDTPRLEGSFCDYWPLAVGNEWSHTEGGGPPILTSLYFYRITDRFIVNGCEVWEFSCEYYQELGGGIWNAYLTFAGGEVYVTPNRADTAALPTISGGFYASMPQTFKTGTHYTLHLDWLHNNTPMSIEVTPTVTYDYVQIYWIGLRRGRGIWFGPDDQVTIVGGCGGIFSATIEPPRRWYQVGGPLDLRVLVPCTDSGLNYQWLKNGTAILDQTDAQLAFIPQTEQDNGVYSCVISDDAKAFHETEGVSIQLLPAGSLPVAGAAGILLMFAGCVAAARRYCRRS